MFAPETWSPYMMCAHHIWGPGSRGKHRMLLSTTPSSCHCCSTRRTPRVTDKTVPLQEFRHAKQDALLTRIQTATFDDSDCDDSDSQQRGSGWGGRQQVVHGKDPFCGDWLQSGGGSGNTTRMSASWSTPLAVCQRRRGVDHDAVSLPPPPPGSSPYFGWKSPYS